jgi:UPF0176 protein
MDSIKVTSLYCFLELNSIDKKKNQLLDLCASLKIKGLIILSREGINGTIAGEENRVDLFIQQMGSIITHADLNLKETLAKRNPFGRMKVKIKKEIVTLGIAGISENDDVGIYVEPNKWDELIRSQNVVTIDTRNNYEIAIGSFTGAINPKTENFSDFPEWWRANKERFEGKAIAMFCTGGIRCEKSTKLLLKEGVEKVYHLKGGILNYLAKYKGPGSQWKGECFVFDQRVSLGKNLKEGSCSLCFACRRPLTPDELLHPQYEEGISCRHCYQKTCLEQKKNFRERQKQIKIADQRGDKHLKYF